MKGTSRGRGRGPLVRGVATALAGGALLLVALGVLGRAVEGGDPELARFLVKQGKAAYEKGQFEDALTKFRKAREEDPDALAALWWAGQTHEKRGESKEAVLAYRDFVEAFAVKRRAGTTTADEATIFKKAQARMDVLAAGEAEWRALEEGYLVRLLALARTHAGKDPVIAERALRLALDADPDHAPAIELLGKLGGKPAATAAAKDKGREKADLPEKDAGKGVKAWRDLLDEKAFSAEEWEHETESKLVVDLPKHNGTICWLRKEPEPASSFVIEMEARVLAEHEDGWLWGPAFGRAGNFGYQVAVQKTQIAFLRADYGGGHDELGESAIPAIELDEWHRLVVDVRGCKVAVWFDGKLLIEHEVADVTDLTGNIGSWQQRCKVEYRKYRFGVRGD